MAPTNIPPALDLSVRVGCSLAYEVTGTATLLLNLKPTPDRNHLVIAEALALGLGAICAPRSFPTAMAITSLA